MEISLPPTPMGGDPGVSASFYHQASAARCTVHRACLSPGPGWMEAQGAPHGSPLHPSPRPQTPQEHTAGLTSACCRLGTTIPSRPRAWGGPLFNSHSTWDSFYLLSRTIGPLAHLAQCSHRSHLQGPAPFCPSERAIVSVPAFIYPPKDSKMTFCPSVCRREWGKPLCLLQAPSCRLLLSRSSYSSVRLYSIPLLFEDCVEHQQRGIRFMY